MKNYLTLFTVSAALLVAACAQSGSNSGINKQQAGTVLGGIGGGIAGNSIGKGQGRTVATIGGAVLGGLAGNSVGGSLDRADANSYNQQNYGNPQNANSIQNALENARTGETYNWAENGNVGTITPTSTFVNNNGQNCRNYVKADRYGNQSNGTACRQGNGYWN